MRFPRRAAAAFTAVVATATVVAGCTSDAPAITDNTKCQPICTGSTAGARYEIRVPKDWNGTLLLYSHGYRIDNGKGPGKAAVTQTDDTGTGSDDVTAELLQRGYALAGSSYASAGWSVQDGLAAADAVHRTFVAKVGAPKRVIAWGSSMGGLVTELLAEQRSWVDGAAPMCGVLAGATRFADSLLLGAQAVGALLSPDTPIRGWSTAKDALSAASELTGAMNTAARRVDGGVQKLVYLADALGIGLPANNATKSRLGLGAAAARSVNQFVTTGITIRYEMERRFDGKVGQTTPAAVPALSSSAAARLVALGGDATSLEGTIATLPGLRGSATARTALAASGEPTGRLRVPTITMHTELDPLAIPANETLLREQAAATGTEAKLRQVFIGASPVGAGTAYGAGHCDFTTGQQVGVVNAVDTWVRTGTAPSTVQLGSAVGDGADSGYIPSAWPLPVQR